MDGVLLVEPRKTAKHARGTVREGARNTCIIQAYQAGHLGRVADAGEEGRGGGVAAAQPVQAAAQGLLGS